MVWGYIRLGLGRRRYGPPEPRLSPVAGIVANAVVAALLQLHMTGNNNLREGHRPGY